MPKEELVFISGINVWGSTGTPSISFLALGADNEDTLEWITAKF